MHAPFYLMRISHSGQFSTYSHANVGRRLASESHWPLVASAKAWVGDGESADVYTHKYGPRFEFRITQGYRLEAGISREASEGIISRVGKGHMKPS